MRILQNFWISHVQSQLNHVLKYITRLMLEWKTFLYACDIKARFLFHFLSHINTGRVFADDDGSDVTYELLWRRFICAFLMLWKVHRECCNSRNCNLGWADDCVPEITMVRLTDSSNSRYYVRHYGDVDTVIMFMAWESPSP